MKAKVPRSAFTWFLAVALALSGGSGVLAVEALDGSRMAAHNDVVYLAPAREGWEGLPLGNGTFGAQVWQPDGLMFQFNTPWSGALGGAIARLRFRTTPSMLASMKSYEQRLSLGTAMLTTRICSEPGEVQVRSFIPAQTDALVMEVSDSRAGENAGFVELEAWRATATRSAGDGVLLIADSLKQGTEYHYALAVGVRGVRAMADPAGPSTVQLSFTGRNYTIYAAFAASLDPKVDVAALARAKLEAVQVQGGGELARTHQAWWSGFWDKSFIQLSADDGGTADYLANLWYLHIYAMGAGSRGEVPPKFNGGLWTYDRDTREWGWGYWHWNTQETYWPLYAANHLELIEPYYRMYYAMLPKTERQTKEYFGVDGAHYEETIAWDGTYACGKGPKVMGIHSHLPVSKSDGGTAMILSSGAEIAMQFWWQYLYTGDKAFLRERAYPVLRSVAEFYVNYLDKDPDGHYFIYPANAHETYRPVKNPATDLAGIRYIFPALIQASRILDVDESRRPVWQDRLDHLAPYHVSEKTGGIAPFEPRPLEKVEAGNCENPELAPVGVLPLITQDTPEAELGIRAFRGRSFVNACGWTTDSICAARLGLVDDLLKLLCAHAETHQDHPSGLMDYYDRKPAIHIYLEGSGTFATAMGELLLRSFGDTPASQPNIRVCPALPKTWDAHFKLLAMGGFEVKASAKRGQVAALAILSTRGGRMTLANPFAAETLVLEGERTVLKSEARLLNVETAAGRSYRVVPANAPNASLDPLPSPPNQAPKRLTDVSRRWIGKQTEESTRWKPPVETDPPQPPSLPADAARDANPTVSPVRARSAPVIDGNLDDACWNGCPTLKGFLRLGEKNLAREQTEVKLAFDDAFLYLGITCWESRMESIQADYEAGEKNRDLPIFQDDSVEVFIQAQPEAYWHFAVNALGAVYDARLSEGRVQAREFNPAWKVAVKRMSNRWQVEAAIPLNALAPIPPAANQVWGFNVCRNEKAGGELSTWAPLSERAYHLPKQFGKLVFSGTTAQSTSVTQDPDLVAWWTCDAVRGQWVLDSSGHDHHALVFGQLGPVRGRAGQALQFGAGFLEIPDSPALNFSNAFTFAAWIRPAVKGDMRIIDKCPVGGAEAFMLDTHPENHLRVISRAASLNTTQILPENVWSHVALTFGKRTMRLYLNGKLIAEQPDCRSDLTPTTLPLRLGADADGGSVFNGMISEVRLWRRTLRPEEIASWSETK